MQITLEGSMQITLEGDEVMFTINGNKLPSGRVRCFPPATLARMCEDARNFFESGGGRLTILGSISDYWPGGLMPRSG